MKKYNKGRANHKGVFITYWTFVKSIVKKIFAHRIFISITSGVFVGLIFGFIILFMFNNEEYEHISTATNKNNELVDHAGKSDHKVNKEQLYFSFKVVQVGLFNNEANALRVKQQLEEKRVSSFVWKRQDEYYLFTNLYSEDSSMDKHDETILDELQIDYFLKQWDLALATDNLSSKDEKWLQEIVFLIEETILKETAHTLSTKEKWEYFLQNNEPKLEQLQVAKQNIEEKLVDGRFDQYDALFILYEIEKKFHQ